MTHKRVESLVEVWMVDEWKEGAIYKTHKVCEAWVPSDVKSTDPRDIRVQYVPLSDARLIELNYKVIRTVMYEE